MSRHYITVEEQHIIIERANKRCEYCQSWMEYAIQPFVFDHVTAVSRSGQTTLENLALACGGCNGHKYNKIEAVDPISQEAVPLYNPRQQLWLEHFGWSEDYLRVIGLTSIGRATVETLQMNRMGVVNMCKLLLLAGLHPPDFKL